MLAVVRGIRPSIPEDIPQKMRHVWSIAQDCWSGNPWDRPTFRTVLQKLNNLAYIKDDDPLPTPVSNQWKDLLDPDLPLENFDTLLMNLLDNATETGKMQGLNEQEAQNLIDVLGKVRTLLVSRFLFTKAPYPVPWDRGCHGRAAEEMLRVPVFDLRHQRSATDTIHAEAE